MADPIPVLIKDLATRGSINGTEIIPTQRETESIAYGSTLNSIHSSRFHHASRDPQASDNTGSGVGDHHFWINDTEETLWLKLGETGGSADWLPLGAIGGGGSGGAATAIVETDGPTTLAVGDVLDGQFLRRVGSELVGTYDVSGGLETVAANRSVGASDAGKTLMLTEALNLTLENAASPTRLTAVNVASESVQVVAGSGVTLVPGPVALPPADSYAAGMVELITAGDGVWVVLLGGQREDVLMVAVSDEVSPLSALPGRLSMRMPYAMTVTRVRANVVDAPEGAPLIVDINSEGSTILGSKLQIDAGDLTSEGSTSPSVVSVSSLADDSLLSVDIDQVGSTTPGAGLKLSIYGIRG